MFSILAVIPTADKTTSASITSIPLAVLMFTLQTAPVVSTDSTEEPVMILIPDFLNERAKFLEISSSSKGTMLSKNSTIVTFVPIELYT